MSDCDHDYKWVKKILTCKHCGRTIRIPGTGGK